jgi:hypothetical protein
MNDINVRLACLELAARTPGEVLANAKAMYDFVMTNVDEPIANSEVPV